MAKRIEVFTAGTHLCEEFVQRIKGIVCSKCEVILYPLNASEVTHEAKEKAIEYEIQSVPSIVVDGKLENLLLMKKQMDSISRARQG